MRVPGPVMFILVVLGCGLRSDPSGGPIGDGFQPIPTCAEPEEIVPGEPIEGLLAGEGVSQGACGNDEGPEAVYSFQPTKDEQVLVEMLETETDSPIALRIQDNGECEVVQQPPVVCSRDALGKQFHFLAKRETQYYFIVDAPAEVESSFVLSVELGAPPLSNCDILEGEPIVARPGTALTIPGELRGGQGWTDGRCGGPGSEHLYSLAVEVPVDVQAQVRADGLDPVISIRRHCSAKSELACSQEDDDRGSASLTATIDTPGDYFVSVDHRNTKAGEYELQLSFK